MPSTIHFQVFSLVMSGSIRQEGASDWIGGSGKMCAEEGLKCGCYCS